MIVIGVDVHKQSLTAVAVDEAGRALSELTVGSAQELLIWSASLEPERLRELKLLVDHRDDLVDERRRAQQRLRWHLHELDPALAVPAGALDRTVWLDRLPRR